MADKWKDNTSYSQGETRGGKKPEPRSWLLGEHRQGLHLFRHHSTPGAWYLTCYSLDIEQRQLDATDLEDAKKEALEYVRKRVISMVAYYKKLGVKL